MAKILVLEDDNDIETFLERLQNQSWSDLANILNGVDAIVLKAPNLKKTF